jgi:hypothetical protein
VHDLLSFYLFSFSLATNRYICQVLTLPSARWHRTATTTTRGSIHSARPLPISSHPGAKQRTLLISERWHRTATCSASFHPGCLRTEHFSFTDRALASYCYPPRYFYSLRPGCQVELTDHHAVLTSHASLTASVGTALPRQHHRQIHPLGTSAPTTLFVPRLRQGRFHPPSALQHTNTSGPVNSARLLQLSATSKHGECHTDRSAEM